LPFLTTKYTIVLVLFFRKRALGRLIGHRGRPVVITPVRIAPTNRYSARKAASGDTNADFTVFSWTKIKKFPVSFRVPVNGLPSRRPSVVGELSDC
jgi:hypothetical protein